jgi:hypothetical protein
MVLVTMGEFLAGPAFTQTRSKIFMALLLGWTGHSGFSGCAFPPGGARAILNGSAILRRHRSDLPGAFPGVDELRANPNLGSSEYSLRVLALIFLRSADYQLGETRSGFLFEKPDAELCDRRTTNSIEGCSCRKQRGSPRLPVRTDVGEAINEAMKAIETKIADLLEVLPETYNRFSFLGGFAMSAGRRTSRRGELGGSGLPGRYGPGRTATLV